MIQDGRRSSGVNAVNTPRREERRGEEEERSNGKEKGSKRMWRMLRRFGAAPAAAFHHISRFIVSGNERETERERERDRERERYGQPRR